MRRIVAIYRVLPCVGHYGLLFANQLLLMPQHNPKRLFFLKKNYHFSSKNIKIRVYRVFFFSVQGSKINKCYRQALKLGLFDFNIQAFTLESNVEL